MTRQHGHLLQLALVIIGLLLALEAPAITSSTSLPFAGFTPSTTVNLALSYSGTPTNRDALAGIHNELDIDDMTITLSAASSSSGYIWIYGHSSAPLNHGETYWLMPAQAVLMPAGNTQQSGTVPFGPRCSQPASGMNTWNQTYMYRAQLSTTANTTVSSPLQYLIIVDTQPS